MKSKYESPFIAHINDGRTIRRPDFSSLAIFKEAGPKLVKTYDDFCSRYNGEPPYQNLRTALLQMPIFAQTLDVDFSCNKSVTDFLYGFRTYLFTTSNLRANLPTRNDYWMVFRGYIQFAMQEGVITKGLIPPGSKKLNNRSIFREHQLIEKMNSENPYDEKSIISINLSSTDEQYLDELELEFVAVKDAFLSASLKEINGIKEKFNSGKKLAQKVQWETLQKKLKIAKKQGLPCHDLQGSRALHLFRHNHPNYLSNVLCYINNKHQGFYLGYKNCGLDSKTDDALKYLNQSHGAISSTELDGYLGRMTTRTLTPFFIYFLIKYPSFRVYSLLDAEIEGKSNSLSNFTSVGTARSL